MADKEKAKAEAAQRPGFDAEGKAYPGVDPDTGERVTVTLAGLKREFGSSKGEEIYRKVAAVAFGGNSPVPVRLDEGARDIGLAGADKDVLEKVNAILSGKE